MTRLQAGQEVDREGGPGAIPNMAQTKRVIDIITRKNIESHLRNEETKMTKGIKIEKEIEKDQDTNKAHIIQEEIVITTDQENIMIDHNKSHKKSNQCPIPIPN